MEIVVNDTIGLYINYLQVGNIIVVPQFKMNSDVAALQILKEVFLNKTVVPFMPPDCRKCRGAELCVMEQSKSENLK